MPQRGESLVNVGEGFHIDPRGFSLKNCAFQFTPNPNQVGMRTHSR
jgi:hypothetical protein